jgi:hypothetical protein
MFFSFLGPSPCDAAKKQNSLRLSFFRLKNQIASSLAGFPLNLNAKCFISFETARLGFDIAFRGLFLSLVKSKISGCGPIKISVRKQNLQLRACVCVCVCVLHERKHVCMYACIRTYTSICMCAYVDLLRTTHKNKSRFFCMRVRVCVCIFIHYTYICTYV